MGADSENLDRSVTLGVSAIVGDSVVHFADPFHEETNQHCLRRLDPEFYHVSADALAPLATQDEGQAAACNLRLLYHHAVESLLALVCASLQAPHYVPGWLATYKTVELRGLVSRISRSQPISVAVRPNQPGWLGFVSMFAARMEPSPTAEDIEQNTLVFHQLARDINDSNMNREYASLKHGLRSSAGGAMLKFAPNDAHGKPIRDREVTLGGEPHGTSFFRYDVISRNPAIRACSHHSLNWDPAVLVDRISWAATWFANVRAMALSMCDQSSHSVIFPDADACNGALRRGTTLPHSSHQYNVDITELKKLIASQGRVAAKTTWPPTQS